jgi:hypothetical protein
MAPAATGHAHLKGIWGEKTLTMGQIVNFRTRADKKT